MVQVYSEVVQFKGRHDDFGYQQGELLRDSPILANRRKQLSTMRKRHLIIDEHEVKHLLQSLAPGIWEEILGLAEALAMSTKDALQEFGGYYKEYGKSGCTIFTDENQLIRNYDNDPLSYEGRYLLFAPETNGYATIGPSMGITGRTDGMNEKGLAIGYNFINRRQSDDGFVCSMIARLVLETCANIDEAVYLLKEIPHRHSFSYVVMDQHDAVIIEASPREVAVRQGFACANHFYILTDENRYRMDDSLRRVRTIEKRQQTVKNAYQAYELMNNIDEGIFSTNYGAWSGTIHTALYNPKQLQAGFALGGNQLPFIFHFNEWLNGKENNVKRIKGELQTDIPFVQMVTL